MATLPSRLPITFITLLLSVARSSVQETSLQVIGSRLYFSGRIIRGGISIPHRSKFSEKKRKALNFTPYLVKRVDSRSLVSTFDRGETEWSDPRTRVPFDAKSTTPGKRWYDLSTSSRRHSWEGDSKRRKKQADEVSARACLRQAAIGEDDSH